MNYMKQVAEILGVELGEEFELEGEDTGSRYRLTMDGLQFLWMDSWATSYVTLQKTLVGTCKVKKLPFKPKREEIYWYVAEDGTTLATQNGYSPCRLVDQYNILHGNCYRTREEAEKHKDEWVQFFKEAVE